ncbi:methyltransferase domain protein [Leptospira interrogans serovar Hebdomadis str. R499]|uniref:Methyltransferase n=1 Tax=Leptospira interrogans serovar Hebdomadis TaxID=211881 RepID=D4HT61_LEPIR|nr:class I SAM-dependent methyltransferase [Leptospira interrogans]ADC94094.1 methyltransferase [Leptospira interrogans serovar Hebdomadis]EKR34192.1 methyltransferase domain protein [Leptospira interrogans serovar Hebdomadis str. R499]OQM31003.1 methyltransferase [Leptospira interrogans]
MSNSNPMNQGIEVYRKYGSAWLESKADENHTREILEMLMSHISEITGAPYILDLCCGYGRLTLPLLEKLLNVVGVDLSPTLIQEAESRRVKLNLGNNMSFQVGDMRRIPFPSSQFDFGFCVWASLNFLSNLEDQTRAFTEIYRVLKPGGKFLIEIPFHEDKNPVVQEIEVEGIKYLYFPFTRSYLENILSKISFQFYSMEEIKIANRKRMVVYMKK